MEMTDTIRLIGALQTNVRFPSNLPLFDSVKRIFYLINQTCLNFFIDHGPGMFLGL